MENKKKPIKLTYEEPLRFDVDKSSLEEQRKIDAYHFSLTCPCGKTFPVGIDFSGNAATCPDCGKQIKIPEENFIRVSCSCGKPLRIPRAAGAGQKCPSCRQPIRLLETSGGAARPGSPQAKISEQGSVTEKAASKTDEPEKRTRTVFVNISCSCGKKLVLPLPLAQQPIKCPQCQKVFSLPEKNFIRINCPCGMEFKVLRILEGNYGKCPKCGKVLKITENKA